MARPKRFKQDNELGTVTIRMPAEILRLIDSEVDARKNKGNKITRSDYIREACEEYAGLIRCPKCGALNNKKATICAECGYEISPEVYYSKLVGDLLKDIERYLGETEAVVKESADMMEKCEEDYHLNIREKIKKDEKSFEKYFREKFGERSMLETHDCLVKKYPDKHVLRCDKYGCYFLEDVEGIKREVMRVKRMFLSLHDMQKEDEETKEMRPLTEKERVYVLVPLKHDCELLKAELYKDWAAAYDVFYEMETYLQSAKDQYGEEEDEE